MSGMKKELYKYIDAVTILPSLSFFFLRSSTNFPRSNFILFDAVGPDHKLYPPYGAAWLT